MQHAANRASYTCDYGFAETQSGYAHGPLLFAAAMNVFGPVLSCLQPDARNSSFPVSPPLLYSFNSVFRYRRTGAKNNIRIEIHQPNVDIRQMTQTIDPKSLVQSRSVLRAKLPPYAPLALAGRRLNARG